MTELEREQLCFGAVIRTCEKLQGDVAAFVEARRGLLASGTDTPDAVPAQLVNALARFLARINAAPEPSAKERRITELKANIERAEGVIDLMKQSGASDHSAQQRRKDVQEWILRDETELKNLLKE